MSSQQRTPHAAGTNRRGTDARSGKARAAGRANGHTSGGRGTPPPVSPEVFRRRRAVVFGGAVIVVILVLAATAFGWPGWARSSRPAAPAVAQQAVPTPTIAPIEPDDGSAFADAQPVAVAEFALTHREPASEWAQLDAMEAYELTFADGEGADAKSITVTAGQWATDEDATRAAADLIKAAGTPTSTGEVKASGRTAGSFAMVVDGDQATMTWRNATAVIQATGPADRLQDFYENYPM